MNALYFWPLNIWCYVITVSFALVGATVNPHHSVMKLASTSLILNITRGFLCVFLFMYYMYHTILFQMPLRPQSLSILMTLYFLCTSNWRLRGNLRPRSLSLACCKRIQTMTSLVHTKPTNTNVCSSAGFVLLCNDVTLRCHDIYLCRCVNSCIHSGVTTREADKYPQLLQSDLTWNTEM